MTSFTNTTVGVSEAPKRPLSYQQSSSMDIQSFLASMRVVVVLAQALEVANVA